MLRNTSQLLRNTQNVACYVALPSPAYAYAYAYACKESNTYVGTHTPLRHHANPQRDLNEQRCAIRKTRNPRVRLQVCVLGSVRGKEAVVGFGSMRILDGPDRRNAGDPHYAMPGAGVLAKETSPDSAPLKSDPGSFQAVLRTVDTPAPLFAFPGLTQPQGGGF